MKYQKKQIIIFTFIFLVIFFLGFIISYCLFHNNIKESSTESLSTIINQMESSTKYHMQLNGRVNENVFITESDITIQEKYNSIYLDIQFSNDSEHSTTMAYDFDYNKSEILQKIYYQESLLKTNEITPKEENYDITLVDSTRILSFFTSFLKKGSQYCKDNECKYILNNEETKQLRTMLIYPTFDVYTDIFDKNVLPTIIIYLDFIKNSIDKITIEFDSNNNLQLIFNSFDKN